MSLKLLVVIVHNAPSNLQFFFSSDITGEYYNEYIQHQFVPLARSTNPPQLLICYSSSDGSAHVRVVLQLATFVQKHMATEVKTFVQVYYNIRNI